MNIHPLPKNCMIKFSNLEINESELQPESISTINENVQSWSRVVVSLSKSNFFDDPVTRCSEWLAENATSDYRLVVQQSNNYDSHSKYIHNLIIRFREPTDAIMFKLTDPLSDDSSSPL